MSSNAVTESGVLYNVDGNGNRVAALTFGPKSVIVVIGYNKIVKDLDEAVRRVKTVSAPANVVRLNCDTYCRHTEMCIRDSRFCSGDRCYAGKADRKKCFPAYCLKSRNSDRIQRPLRAKLSLIHI